MKFMIYAFFSYSAIFPDEKMVVDGNKIELLQTERGLLIKVEFDREEDFLKSEGRFVIRDVGALLNRIIPVINEKLHKIKYNNAHILISTISMLDIHYLYVEDQSIMKGLGFGRPFVIESFPPLVGASENNEIFIRDYIDAMTNYFKYDIDDCIRRGITSLENYCIFLNVKGRESTLQFKSGSRPTFMSKVEELLSEKENFIMPPLVINEALKTIWLVYEIRNSIVHKKIRLHTNERWVCNRMIYALYNIYNARFGALGLNSLYIMRLGMQFQAIDSIVSENEFKDNYTLAFSSDQIEFLCKKFGLTMPTVLLNGKYPHSV